MSSEAQIAANRANSQKSTGPRTPETKLITRLNAKRDGLTGQIATLTDEDRPVFEKHKADLIQDLAPKTVMELKLASAIAWDTWRLDFLRATEMNIYAVGTDDPDNEVSCDDPHVRHALITARTFCKESRRFELMSIYEQRMNRSLHKNLATLRAMQAERRAQYNREHDHEVCIARACDINGLQYQAPAATVTNGFVFSNHEIIAAAARQRSFEAAEQVVRAGNSSPRGPKSGLRMASAA